VSSRESSLLSGWTLEESLSDIPAGLLVDVLGLRPVTLLLELGALVMLSTFGSGRRPLPVTVANIGGSKDM
jgi:hypothetical protein